MAWTVLSPSEISSRLRGSLRRYLPGTDALIWPNNLTPIVKVFALGLHDMHLRASWLYDQIFASTASVQHLDRHATELGLVRRSVSRAEGLVTTSGVPNTIYPAGIRYLSGNRLYRSISDVRSDGAGALVLAVISEDFGAAMNAEAGVELTRADPSLFAGLSQAAIVGSSGIGGGADTETNKSLRSRVLDRKRRPPQGGAISDYEQFARAVPGVTQAWAWSWVHGPGTVGVWFLFEGRENGIPTPGDVAVVQEALDVRRLIRANAVASAPLPKPLNITIAGLGDDTTTTREAIDRSLRAMLVERARPGVSFSAFVLSRSWIGEAISAAIGEDRHKLILPADDLTYYNGEMPVLGEVTYE